MATRSPRPKNDLTAAALILEEKGQGSLLYNSTVIDYLVNSTANGQTALAWYYWSRIPELRYTSRYISNALSVATLYVGLADGTESMPVKLAENHPANDLMLDFAGGFVGQSELLDRLGLHLTVTGDSIIVGPKNGTGALEAPFDQWRVYSTEEVYSRNGKIYLRMPGNSKEVQIPEGAMAVRIWRPHPQRWWDADSPVKGSFSVLRELDLLDQHVHSTAVSRLSGAGLLGIPEELDLPGSDMEVEGTEIDHFVAMLTEIMGLAVKNPESAAARVPIMLRGPAEFIDKIKHFDFSTAFDAQVPELRLGAIRRLALGMDVPPEILLGSAGSTSWSAWQTDEATLRVHLVPLLQLICSSLTVGWLRPMLESLPLTDAQKAEIPNLVIHFDVNKLKIRQNISGDAEALYDRFGIDSDAMLLAMGYGPDSAPNNEELAKQILFSIIKGGNPQMVPYAITALRDNFGLKLLPDIKEVNAEGAAFPRATEQIGPGGNPEAKPGATPGPGVPAPGAPTNPVGPPTKPPAPANTSGKEALPGKRSQDKQVSPPPTPKIGDQSNNSNK